MLTASKSPTKIALSVEYAAMEMLSFIIFIKAKYSEDIGGASIKRIMSVTYMIFIRRHTHSIPVSFMFASLLKG